MTNSRPMQAGLDAVKNMKSKLKGENRVEYKRRIRALEYKEIHRNTTGAFPVRIFQRRPDDFKIQYGKQVKENLTYLAAAHEYGECIFHSFAMQGLIDNA